LSTGVEEAMASKCPSLDQLGKLFKSLPRDEELSGEDA
jgi:hypothetical protein